MIKIKKKEYQVNDITIDLRMEILDEAMVAATEQKFSSFVKIIRKAVKITDEQLMEMSTEDISRLGQKVVEMMNEGKKSTKSK